MKSFLYISIGSFVLSAGIFSTALAIGDDFLVSTLIGSDTQAPTVPVGFVASAISSDQIDLGWLPSSDNFSVDGYQIWRDDIQIATTTLTSYSDISLTPATLYRYYVTAFDTFYNISASSTISATTTLALLLPAASTPPASQNNSTRLDSQSVNISDWKVVPFENSVVVTFTTDQFVRSDLRWGTNASYEIGYSSQGTLRQTHKIVIDMLDSGAKYSFQLVLLNRFGKPAGSREFSVTTISAQDITPPPNVDNFLGIVKNKDIALSWQNPNVSDFAYVRVVRSEQFFPQDSADGIVVYEGNRDNIVDTNLRNGIMRYYYSIFAYDKSGNRSSGAVTLVVLPGDVIDTVATTTKEALNPLPSILFQQGNFAQYSSTSSPIRLLLGETTTISIPYDMLPPNLKTIIVTFTHQDTNTHFSFLLKNNSDRTAYEAVIGPLSQSGFYDISIEVFDYKLKTVSKSYFTAVVAGDVLLDETTSSVFPAVYWMLSPLLLLVLYMIWRRNQSPN